MASPPTPNGPDGRSDMVATLRSCYRPHDTPRREWMAPSVQSSPEMSSSLSSSTPVAVTGPLGFIGRRVVDALVAEAVPVRGLVRRAVPENAAFSPVSGDLLDPEAVARLVAGVQTVVHSAVAIGGDDDAVRRTNVDGTRIVVEAAAEAGARVVLVSTAAVFGSGPHRGGPRPGATPESATSVSRAEAERLVLGAGGAVVRPNVVHGVGDRWVFPSALRLVTAVGAVPDTEARVSVVHVRTLGRRIAAAALTRASGVVPVHTDPPVAAGEVVVTAAEVLGRSLPPVVSVEEFRDRAAGRGLSSHQLAMLLDDAWFDVADPEPLGTLELDAEDRDWYRSLAG
ncbi:hypothetical protein DEI82_03710 [Curtobacterium sp. MCBD17_019]|nr:hypothetical protein DEI82_03710 [Curtobacterium sp. MCBD17_019]